MYRASSTVYFQDQFVLHPHTRKHQHRDYTYKTAQIVQGVSGEIVNILGGGRIDYAE
jgi:hypothetical protein